MAQWKKIIVSGSNADLAIVSASNAIVVGAAGYNVIGTDQSNTTLSGSFTGSFKGTFDGTSNLPDLTQAAGGGITPFTYDGSTTATIAVSGAAQLSANTIVKWDDTDNKFINTSITDNGTIVGGTTSLQFSGANSSLTGSFTGTFAGDGANLTGLVSTLGITGSDSSTGTVQLKTQNLTITGVANEINTTVSGQTVTIGLPDSVSITSDLTVGGNLNVNGDLTYINVANLAVEDKFILLNSGSTNPDEAGLVVDEGNGIGHAFAFDAGNLRWGFSGSFDSTATSFAPDAYVASVVTTDIPAYQQVGNIRVEAGEIYIYV
jgi:hypothetical protein